MNTPLKTTLAFAVLILFQQPATAQDCPTDLILTPVSYTCNQANQTYDAVFIIKAPAPVSDPWYGSNVTPDLGNISTECQFNFSPGNPDCNYVDPPVWNWICACDGRTYEEAGYPDFTGCSGMTIVSNSPCDGTYPVRYYLTDVPFGLDVTLTVSVTLVHSFPDLFWLPCEYTLILPAPPSPIQPGNISGAATVCAGASTMYSVSNLPGVTGFQWTVPNGASIVSGQGTNTVQVQWGNTSGNICVSSTTDCGVSAATCRAVTVAPHIGLTGITSNGLTGAFTLTGGLPQADGSDYASVTMTLQGNPGVVATLTGAPFTHNETAGFTAPQAGTYTVVVTDNFGCTGAATVVVSGGGGGAMGTPPCIAWQKCLGGSSVESANDIVATSDGNYVVLSDSYSNDGDVTGNHGDEDVWLTKVDATGHILWQKSYGGSNYDVGSSIQLTSDGGFIIAVQTLSNDGDVPTNHGLDDVWIIKTDASGNMLWSKIYGGSASDAPNQIQITASGGYIISGNTTSSDGDVTSNHGNRDVWVMELNSAGNMLWQKSLGGSEFEIGNALQVTPDGGCIIAAISNSNDGDVSGNHGFNDFWVIKLGPSGNLMWQKTYGGGDDEDPLSICLTPDGGYALTGFSFSNDGKATGNHGDKDIWTIKIDATGNLLWNKMLGGSAEDFPFTIKTTFNGGFIIAGFSASNNGDIPINYGEGDGSLIKLDDSGNLLWQKTIGGTADDGIFCALSLPGEKYIVGGFTRSNDIDVSGNHGLADSWVVEFQNPVLPTCPSLLSPAPNATNVPVSTALSWNNLMGCLDGYHLCIGTTPGGTELLFNQAVTDTFYQPATALPAGATIYARIYPFNSLGEPALCQEYTFTTTGCNIAVTNIQSTGLTGSFTLTGGLPQTNGSNYASVTMALQGSPGVTATLTGAPFTHNEVAGFTAPQAGTYTVTATDAGGCSGTATVVVSSGGGGGTGVAPCIEWQKCLGGSDVDGVEDIQETNTGGFLIAAYSASIDGNLTANKGSSDAWVINLNADGSLQWQKTIGGSNSDFGISINQTNDGGSILGGYSFSNDGDVSGNHGDADYWALKLDAVGNVQWQKALGGSGEDILYAIRPTSDGGYVMTGTTESSDGNITGAHGLQDIWVVKLDGSGNIQWQKTLGGSDDEWSFDIQQVSDGGFVVTGGSYSTDGDLTGNQGFGDYWVVKLNAIGNIQWQKSMGGSAGEFAESIRETADGGFIIAGYSNSNDGDVSGNHGGLEDAWVVKTNALGIIQWQKTLGGSNRDEIKSIEQTADGGYMFAGFTDSNDGDVSGNNGTIDYWLGKLDATGNLLWQKSLGGTLDEYALSAQATSDNGFIVAGVTNSSNGDISGSHGNLDGWLVKLKTLTLPVCASLVSPTPNATNVPVSTALSWSSATGCLVGYHLSLGTTPGGSDLLNNQTVTDTFYQPAQPLPGGTKIYVRIIPFNSLGDATGCQEFSFTTAAGCNIAVTNIQSTGLTGFFTLTGGLPQTNGSNYATVTMTLQGSPGVMATLTGAPFTHNEVAGFTAPQAGTYTVTATDAGGCSGTATVVVSSGSGGGTGVAPCIEWQKCLGGSDSDVADRILETLDGGFIMAGTTISNNGDVSGLHGFTDLWIVKTDATGNIQWQKTLGGTEFDFVSTIHQTSDNGFIVGGITNSTDGDVSGSHGGGEFWLVKLNNSGAIQWQKSFGGSNADACSDVQITADGGFVLVGETESIDGNVTGNQGWSDFWVLKLDATGTIQWQRTFGGSAPDDANFIQQTPDGGFIVIGNTKSNDGDVSGNHGGQDFWVIRLDATGNLQWQKSIGGSGEEYGSFIQATPDGGFIVGGNTESNNGDVSGNHGGKDAWLVKLNAAGTIQWQKTLGGSSNDAGYSIQPTSDAKYVLIGATQSNDGDVSGNHGNYDAWLVKFDASGSIEWQKTLGGSEDEVGTCIQMTSDDGLIIAGYTASNNGDASGNHGSDDAWVVKLQNPALPACPTLLSPAPNATNVPVSTALSWSSVTGCLDGYHLSLGTTPGGSDLLNNQTVTDTFYQPAQPLPGGTKIYVRIIPFNGLGEAGSCLEYAFTTAATCNITVTNIQSTGLTGSFTLTGGLPQTNGSNYATVTMALQGSPGVTATLTGAPFTHNEVAGFTAPQAGTYTVTATDAGGCSGTATVVVTTGGGGSTGMACIEWQKCLGGSDEDGASSIQKTSDGGLIVAGTILSNDGNITGNHGSRDIWVVKQSATGDIQWQKALGGADDEFGQSIQQTNDGGFVVAGYSFSNDGDVSGNHGLADFWVVKLSATGGIQWQKMIGGSGNDWAYDIQQTTDGGFVVAGITTSNDGDVSGYHGVVDLWVVKLNAAGNIQWQKVIGGSDTDYAHRVHQTNDGGFIMTGYTNSNDGDVSGNHGAVDFWVVKVNALGVLQWQKTLGGSNFDISFSSVLTSDESVLVTGATDSNDGDVTGNHGGNDLWIVKLNPAGNMLWQKTFGGTGEDYADDIKQANDGGFVLCGTSESNDGDVSGNHGVNDFWIIKLDANGNLQWGSTLGGSGEDYPEGIEQLDNGALLVSGYTESNDGDVSGNHGNFDYWVVKLKDVSCPTLLSPAPNATNIPTTASLTWSSANGCFDGYHLSLGTTPGGTDLLDSHTVADTFYQPAQKLPGSSTIYAQIIPFNSSGEAGGCSEFSFTTAGDGPALDEDAIKELIPNVITPNDDGFNDTFDPAQILTDNGIATEEIELFIINRWGEVIHHSNDGRWEGKAPQATYYYRLRFVVAGKEYQVKGPVNLLQ